MTHPPSGPDTGSPPTGPGRMSDRALLRIFTLPLIVLAVVLAVAVVWAGGAW